MYGSLEKLSERFAEVPVEKAREEAKNRKRRKHELARVPKRTHIQINDLLA